MDLIDRDNLKEAIKMAITVPVDCSYDLGYNDMVLNAVKIVDSMPTIDAQPGKHGRWERDASGELNCSYCGYAPKWDDDKFCANCGAKMEA